MYCPKCGRVIPDDAKFCTFCGADMEPAPRHAKPVPAEEEIYSYSDDNMPRDIDEQRFSDARDYHPEQGAMEETKVYDFGMFEEHHDDGYDQEPLPYGDEYSGDVDPYDSYEMYQDGEDDDTFMDKLDNKFRRYDDEEDDEPKKKNLLWLWISIIAFLLVLLILFGILLFTGALSKDKKNDTPAATTSSAVATTAPTTAKATTPAATTAPQTEKPTEAPETQAPATQPPATQAPAPTESPAPVVTNPPETEAPTPVPVSSEEEDDNEEEDDSAINSREPIN